MAEPSATPTPAKIHDLPSWLTVSDRILAAANTLAACVEADQRNGAHVVALALLARSMNHMRAARVLIDAGHIVEARVLVRCLVENLLLAAALKDDPGGTFKKLEADYHRSKQLRGKRIMANELSFSDTQRKQVREQLERLKAKLAKPSLLNPSDLASNTPAGLAYHHYAQLSADSAHASLDSLERHIIKGDGPLPAGVSVEPALGLHEEADTVGWGCMALLNIVTAVRDLTLTTGADTGIEAARQAYVAMVE